MGGQNDKYEVCCLVLVKGEGGEGQGGTLNRIKYLSPATLEEGRRRATKKKRDHMLILFFLVESLSLLFSLGLRVRPLLPFVSHTLGFHSPLLAAAVIAAALQCYHNVF